MSFVVAFGIVLALIPVARRVGLATGLVDRPSDPALAIHARPVPLLGGPAVIAAAFIAVTLLNDGLPATVVWATSLALAAGLVDDVRPLPPLVRLVLLAGAGIVLAAGGVTVEPFGALAGVAIVLLTVACTNAVNLIDGQNGLAGGLAALSAAALAGTAPGGSGARSIGLALAGAAVAFLIWNLPGRIFLGNGGAYAVGTLLAALTAVVSTTDGWRGFLAATAALGVFAFEVLFTIWRRVRSGASLTTGDRLHSYDIVAARKESSRMRSTVRFWIYGSVAAGIGLAAARLPVAAAVALVAAGSAAAAAWGVWLWARQVRETGSIPSSGG